MKTAELTGADLALWVARAEGFRVERDGGDGDLICWPTTHCPASFGLHGYRPDIFWAQGGPIIERELIELSHDRDWREDGTFGRVWQGHIVAGHWDGDTALIAAMRAYVADKFGDTVPDEQS